MSLYRVITATAAIALAMQHASSAEPAPPTAEASPAVPVEEIEAQLRDAATKASFSGIVAIARDGKGAFTKSYGFANRETAEPITADTQFGLASVDKFITRLAIFQLLQAGKLQLTDPVGKLLPGLPNEELKQKVTVQHLLDMSAGVPSFWNERYFERLKQLRSTDDYLDLFVREPLRFEPGSKREYSNGGYVVLGAIIERLSGMPYEAYVKANILEPAGMKNTGLFPNGRVQSGRAIGYTRAGGAAGGQLRPSPSRDQGSAAGGGIAPSADAPLRPNLPTLAFKGSPAGGGYSTANDLMRLDRAIRSDRLLQPKYTDMFLKGSFRTGEGRPTGWSGGTPGHNVQFIMYPDGITLIVLANQDPPAANRIASTVAKAMGKALSPG